MADSVASEAAPSRLHLVPLTLAQANEHVGAWHRHNRPIPGAKFSIGVADDDGVLRAVAIIGRPVARNFDDGVTLEVNRMATEGGASLRAAGWKVIAERPANKGWSVPSRPRDNSRYPTSVARQLWEAVA